MRKAKKYSDQGSDDSDLFSDQDFDLNGFMDTMDKDGKQGKRQSKVHRKTRQRLDDWRESRLLHAQLQDWSDWD
jgi:hypothetical protein